MLSCFSYIYFFKSWKGSFSCLYNRCLKSNFLWFSQWKGPAWLTCLSVCTTAEILVQRYIWLRRMSDPRAFLGGKQNYLKSPATSVPHRDPSSGQGAVGAGLRLSCSSQNPLLAPRDRRYRLPVVLRCEFLVSSKNPQQWGCQMHSNLPRVLRVPYFRIHTQGAASVCSRG